LIAEDCRKGLHIFVGFVDYPKAIDKPERVEVEPSGKTPGRFVSSGGHSRSL
jgi:hypothetical protein